LRDGQRGIRKSDVELSCCESQCRGRRVLDDRILDAVEIGAVGLPVIRVARYLDVLILLVFDKPERARSGWMLPHLRRRYVTRIHPKAVGCDQHRERRLRPLQMEGSLPVAVDGYLAKIVER